ncbi:hypothetical protein THRCLA_11640 [Thraustotheca clavata]|uniref:Uncharacterized protein n=1 Tax=Thraustotheca clavata TaxID=74557 RepID=A0A1V9Y729_9STRA|nr:hypothetical protein THRCLA_11640 [Thraustotheca clavata]
MKKVNEKRGVNLPKLPGYHDNGPMEPPPVNASPRRGKGIKPIDIDAMPALTSVGPTTPNSAGRGPSLRTRKLEDQNVDVIPVANPAFDVDLSVLDSEIEKLKQIAATAENHVETIYSNDAKRKGYMKQTGNEMNYIEQEISLQKREISLQVDKLENEKKHLEIIIATKDLQIFAHEKERVQLQDALSAQKEAASAEIASRDLANAHLQSQLNECKHALGNTEDSLIQARVLNDELTTSLNHRTTDLDRTKLSLEAALRTIDLETGTLSAQSKRIELLDAALLLAQSNNSQLQSKCDEQKNLIKCYKEELQGHVQAEEKLKTELKTVTEDRNQLSNQIKVLEKAATGVKRQQAKWDAAKATHDADMAALRTKCKMHKEAIENQSKLLRRQEESLVNQTVAHLADVTTIEWQESQLASFEATCASQANDLEIFQAKMQAGELQHMKNRSLIELLQTKLKGLEDLVNRQDNDLRISREHIEEQESHLQAKDKDLASLKQSTEAMIKDLNKQLEDSRATIAEYSGVINAMRSGNDEMLDRYTNQQSHLEYVARENGDLNHRIQALESALQTSEAQQQTTSTKLQEREAKNASNITIFKLQATQAQEQFQREVEALNASMTDAMAKAESERLELESKRTATEISLQELTQASAEMKMAFEEKLRSRMETIEENEEQIHLLEIQIKMNADQASKRRQALQDELDRAKADYNEKLRAAERTFASKVESLEQARQTERNEAAAASSALESNLRGEIASVNELLDAERKSAAESIASLQDVIATKSHQLERVQETADTLAAVLKADTLQFQTRISMLQEEVYAHEHALRDSQTRLKETILRDAATLAECHQSYQNELTQQASTHSEAMATLRETGERTATRIHVAWEGRYLQLQTESTQELVQTMAKYGETVEAMKNHNTHALATMQSSYEAQLQALKEKNRFTFEQLCMEHEDVIGHCHDGYQGQLTHWHDTYQNQLNAHQLRYDTDLSSCHEDYQNRIANSTEHYEGKLAECHLSYNNQLSKCQTSYESQIEALGAELANAKAEHAARFEQLEKSSQEELKSTIDMYEEKLSSIIASYESKLETTIGGYDEKVAYTVASYENELSTTISNYEAKLSSTVTSYEEKLAATIADYENKLSSTITNYDAKLASTIDNYENTLASTTSRYEDTIASSTSKYEQTISAMTSKYEQVIATKTTTYETKITSLTSFYDDKIATSTTAYDTKLSTTIERYEAELIKWHVSYNGELAASRAKYDTDLSACHRDYQTRINTMTENYENQLATCHKSYSEQLQAMESMYREKLATTEVTAKEKLDSTETLLKDKLVATEEYYKDKLETTETTLKDKLHTTETLYKEKLEYTESTLKAKLESTETTYRTRLEALETNFREKLSQCESTYEAELTACHATYQAQFATESEEHEQKLHDTIATSKASIEATHAQSTLQIANLEATLQSTIESYQEQLNMCQQEMIESLQACRDKYETQLALTKKDYETTLKQRQEAYDETLARCIKDHEESMAARKAQYEDILSNRKQVYEETLANRKNEYETTLNSRQHEYEATLSCRLREYEATLNHRQLEFDTTLARRKLENEEAMATTNENYEAQLQTYQSQLSETKASLESQLNSCHASCQAQLAEAKVVYESQVHSLKTSYENQIAEAKAAHKAQVSSLETTHMNEMKDSKFSYENQLKSLKSSYETQISETKASYEGQLSDCKTSYENQLQKNQEIYDAQFSTSLKAYQTDLDRTKTACEAALQQNNEEHLAQVAKFESQLHDAQAKYTNDFDTKALEHTNAIAALERDMNEIQCELKAANKASTEAFEAKIAAMTAEEEKTKQITKDAHTKQIEKMRQMYEEMAMYAEGLNSQLFEVVTALKSTDEELNALKALHKKSVDEYRKLAGMGKDLSSALTGGFVIKRMKDAWLSLLSEQFHPNLVPECQAMSTLDDLQNFVVNLLDLATECQRFVNVAGRLIGVDALEVIVRDNDKLWSGVNCIARQRMESIDQIVQVVIDYDQLLSTYPSIISDLTITPSNSNIIALLTNYQTIRVEATQTLTNSSDLLNDAQIIEAIKDWQSCRTHVAQALGCGRSTCTEAEMIAYIDEYMGLQNQLKQRLHLNKIGAVEIFHYIDEYQSHLTQAGIALAKENIDTATLLDLVDEYEKLRLQVAAIVNMEKELTNAKSILGFVQEYHKVRTQVTQIILAPKASDTLISADSIIKYVDDCRKLRTDISTIWASDVHDISDSLIVATLQEAYSFRQQVASVLQVPRDTLSHGHILRIVQEYTQLKSQVASLLRMTEAVVHSKDIIEIIETYQTLRCDITKLWSSNDTPLWSTPKEIYNYVSEYKDLRVRTATALGREGLCTADEIINVVGSFVELTAKHREITRQKMNTDANNNALQGTMEHMQKALQDYETRLSSLGVKYSCPFQATPDSTATFFLTLDRKLQEGKDMETAFYRRKQAHEQDLQHHISAMEAVQREAAATLDTTLKEWANKVEKAEKARANDVAAVQQSSRAALDTTKAECAAQTTRITNDMKLQVEKLEEELTALKSTKIKEQANYEATINYIQSALQAHTNEADTKDPQDKAAFFARFVDRDRMLMEHVYTSIRSVTQLLTPPKTSTFVLPTELSQAILSCIKELKRMKEYVLGSFDALQRDLPPFLPFEAQWYTVEYTPGKDIVPWYIDCMEKTNEMARLQFNLFLAKANTILTVAMATQRERSYDVLQFLRRSLGQDIESAEKDARTLQLRLADAIAEKDQTSIEIALKESFFSELLGQHEAIAKEMLSKMEAFQQHHIQSMTSLSSPMSSSSHHLIETKFDKVNPSYRPIPKPKWQEEDTTMIIASNGKTLKERFVSDLAVETGQNATQSMASLRKAMTGSVPFQPQPKLERRPTQPYSQANFSPNILYQGIRLISDVSIPISVAYTPTKLGLVVNLFNQQNELLQAIQVTNTSPLLQRFGKPLVELSSAERNQLVESILVRLSTNSANQFELDDQL